MKSEFEQNAECYKDKHLIDFLTRLYCKFSNTRELLVNNHRQHNLLMILCEILRKNHIRLEIEFDPDNDKVAKIGYGIYQPRTDTIYYDCGVSAKTGTIITADKPSRATYNGRRIRQGRE
jgi:hypothetical protein